MRRLTEPLIGALASTDAPGDTSNGSGRPLPPKLRKLSDGTLGVQRLIDAISGHTVERHEAAHGREPCGMSGVEAGLSCHGASTSSLNLAISQATTEHGYMPRTRPLAEVSPPRANPFNDSQVLYHLAKADGADESYTDESALSAPSSAHTPQRLHLGRNEEAASGSFDGERADPW